MAWHQKDDYDQISGVFGSPRDLEELINGLHARGLGDDDISILMSEKTKEHYFAAHEGNKAPEGATLGGLAGGLLGALIGGLTLVGSVVVPGGGLLVAGPLVGALTGGVIGTATGGLIGAMVGAGIPEHEAKFYEAALKEKGNVLVVVHALKDQVKEFKALFERYGAKQVKIHH